MQIKNKNMFDYSKIVYDLPYIINITLYTHNYYDRLLISCIKKDAFYEKDPEDPNCIIIDINDLRHILSTKFNKEINLLDSLSYIDINKSEINSIFFINRLINSFSNLKYIKINISDKRKFTRLVQTEKDKSLIVFNYKVLASILDLTLYLQNKSDYKLFNDFFKEIGLIKDDIFGCKVSYIKISAQELLELIAEFELNKLNNDESFKKYENIIMFLHGVIDQKLEIDNTNLIIITDFTDEN